MAMSIPGPVVRQLNGGSRRRRESYRAGQRRVQCDSGETLTNPESFIRSIREKSEQFQEFKMVEPLFRGLAPVFQM